MEERGHGAACDGHGRTEREVREAARHARVGQPFDLLEEGLKARFPGIRFVSWREFGSTHGGEEREALAALPRRLKDLGVDAVISGMAC